jgi:hypothetical protein
MVGAVVREGCKARVDFITRCWVPCLVIISVQPWSARARRLVPMDRGGLIIC